MPRNHAGHTQEMLGTDHIRNVPYLLTHNLVRCSCGFYGWLPKED